MVISDFYTYYGKPESIPLIKDIFHHAFKLPSAGLGAFICGNVGGFPIGAKITADLYREGGIDKSSAERLMALSSNPSCAFIVGGVGLGMFKDFKTGIILTLSVYLSCIICGVLSKPKSNISNFTYNISKQKYDFVNSVKNAGSNSVSIISFIALFSVIVGFLKKYIKTEGFLYLLTSILEVTNAVELFANSNILSRFFKIAACAFSLGFGGVSVMMQTSVFTANEKLSMKPYFLIKLAQGAISSLLAALIMLFSNV